MADFDLAICIGQDKLNEITQRLFAIPDFQRQFIDQSETADIDGVGLTVTWSLLQPPVIVLSPPSPDQWRAAIKADGSAPAPEDDAFMLTLPAVRIQRSQASGEAQETTIPLTVVGTASVANNDAVLAPLAVIVDLSGASPLDRGVYRKVIIPNLLRMAGEALRHYDLPAISFPQLSFGAATLKVAPGRILAIANLADNPAPLPPPPDYLPGGAFTMLLSAGAIQRVLDAALPGLSNQRRDISGSQGFGIGDARYDASITLRDLRGFVDPNAPTQIHLVTRADMSASAGVSLLGGIFGHITDGVNAVGDVAKQGANAVADTATTVGNTIADGATSAFNAVKNTFSSY